MRTNNLGTQLMHALLAKFEADRLGALATIQLYLNASAGVGDHPTVLNDLATATRALTEAEECLETLQRHFLNNTRPEDDALEE